jgi:hypothetical protein
MTTLKEQIDALLPKVTDSKLADEGHYFTEHSNDLTQCGHGECGHYGNCKDGELVALLWNGYKAGELICVSEVATELKTSMGKYTDAILNLFDGRYSLALEARDAAKLGTDGRIVAQGKIDVLRDLRQDIGS